jgi:hypothetical protein
MEYNYNQINETDWSLEIIKSDAHIIFNLSPVPGIGHPEHIQMIEDFKDASKLEYFISLLIDNPTTAFSIYNSNLNIYNKI